MYNYKFNNNLAVLDKTRNELVVNSGGYDCKKYSIYEINIALKLYKEQVGKSITQQGEYFKTVYKKISDSEFTIASYVDDTEISGNTYYFKEYLDLCKYITRENICNLISSSYVKNLESTSEIEVIDTSSLLGVIIPKTIIRKILDTGLASNTKEQMFALKKNSTRDYINIMESADGLSKYGFTDIDGYWCERYDSSVRIEIYNKTFKNNFSSFSIYDKDLELWNKILAD